MPSIASIQAAKAQAKERADAEVAAAVAARKDKLLRHCFRAYQVETDGSVSGGVLEVETLNLAEAAALAEALSSKKSKKKLSTHYKDAGYGDEPRHDLDASQDVVDVCAEHIEGFDKAARKRAVDSLKEYLED